MSVNSPPPLTPTSSAISDLGTPLNTPRVFHVEMTRKRPFPCRFNVDVEYTWCVCRTHAISFRSLGVQINYWSKDSEKNYQLHNVNKLMRLDLIRNHSLSTYAKFSLKLTSLTPWYAYVRDIYTRNVSFFRKICVRTKLMTPNNKLNLFYNKSFKK